MDLDVYLRFVLALVFVLALIGVVAWVGRRMGVLGRVTMGRANTGRIGVVESTAIDAKRRLVLVRRDGVEHLVLLGPTSETLIESGIRTEGPATP
jgi:flagellar protein FliO/FliZ